MGIYKTQGAKETKVRIDLPVCDIVECKWYSDRNCTNHKAFQRCVYPDKKYKLDKYCEESLVKLKHLIPETEYREILSQYYCELASDFLGFVNVYDPLSKLIPKGCIVIDFGCYVAAQSYFFAEHEKYIGVDVDDLKRFTPQNATHYVMSIQDFINNEAPQLFKEYPNEKFFAICSYVPDDEATELVRRTFKNVCCYYPSISHNNYQIGK